MTSNRRDDADGYVYWIGSDDGDVKIGWALDPEKRLSELQTGNPCKLRVLAVVRGSKRDERALHAKLKEFRGLGEWFQREASLQLAGELGLEPFNENKLCYVRDGWRGAVFWAMRQAYNTVEAQGFLRYGFGSGVKFCGPATAALSDKGYADYQRCVEGLASCFQRLSRELSNRAEYERNYERAIDAEVRDALEALHA
jgi:hypothetical protein